MLQLMLMVLTPALLAAIIWPNLPFSRALVSSLTRLARRIKAKATLGRALIAIGLALFFFGAIWALQGDAPMFLALALPEIAGWLATFEIATLVEAAAGVATAFIVLRASGLGSAIKARVRAPRRRKVTPTKRISANEDEPQRWALAA